jgi:DNA polymerase III delta prime subunit
MHADLLDLLHKKHKIESQGNTDFFDRSYENMTIDDARELKTAHGMRPVGEMGKKIFIIRANAIGHEAQNALLKLFEEPADYAHFFLIVPSAHILLPTVKSRMLEVKHDSGDKIQEESHGEIIEEAEAFVKLTPAKRLDVVKKLVEDVSKEKKTKQDAINFLNAIQAVVYKQGVKKNTSALDAIEHARTYMNDRAPSVKMLLEYVALSI